MATFAEGMVTKLEAVLSSSAGLSKVVLDKKTVEYADVIKQYEYWKKKVALEAGTRPRIIGVNMSGGV